MRNRTAARLASLLPATAFLAAPLPAAEVTVEWVSVADGSRSTIVSGPLDHPIVHVISPDGRSDDMRFIDACGDVFGFEESVLGERTFGEPLQPRHEVRDAMSFHTGRYDGVMFGNDRSLYEIDVSERHRELAGLENFHFRSEPVASGLPLDRVDRLWSRRSGGRFFARMDDGNLMLIRTFEKGNEHARLLDPKKGWGNVADLVADNYVHARSGADSDAFVTLLDDGRLTLYFYEENSGRNGYDLESRPVGDKRYTGVRDMIMAKAIGRTAGLDVILWMENGSLLAVDADTGKERVVGEFNGDRMIPLGHRDGAFLVSAAGHYKACPALEEPKIARTPDPSQTPQGKTIIAAADEIKAIHGAQHARFRERIEKGYPEDIWDKNKAQLTALLMPWLDELKLFESDVVGPVRGKVEAFIETYGERAEANAKLKAYTGSDYYLGMELGELQEDLENHDQYRRDVAETVAREGRTFFQMAQFMSGAEAAENFSRALPYAELALLFDADNALAKEIAARAEQDAELALAAEKAAIEAAVWPADQGNFEFDAGDMKKKILGFFQEHHKDEDHANGARYLAIRLRSGWVPGKVNVLGQLLEWRIGAYIARTIPGDPDHALVIPVQVGTQTSQKDSPFAYRYFSSASYRIPIDRVTVE